jgi:hypothetical protein
MFTSSARRSAMVMPAGDHVFDGLCLGIVVLTVLLHAVFF